jgi:hypothetical protein
MFLKFQGIYRMVREEFAELLDHGCSTERLWYSSYHQ